MDIKFSFKENIAIITGTDQSHLTLLSRDLPFQLHLKVKSPFEKLSEQARSYGFNLQLASSFRSFDQQLLIWNAKAEGKRVLLDTLGNPLSFQELGPREILYAILRWSALPGMSRHHWGTDIDIFDKASLPSKDYQVQLTPEEVNEGGVFFALHQWIDSQIDQNKSFGFFRPYEKDLGGVAPEKWHLSYAPISEEINNELSFELFEKLLKSELYREILLREQIWQEREIIFSQYIKNITPPQWP